MGTKARRQGEEQGKNEGPRHLLVAAPLIDEEEIGLEQQERRGYGTGSGVPGHGAEGDEGDERGRNGEPGEDRRLQDSNRNAGYFGEDSEEGRVGEAMVVRNVDRVDRTLVEHSPSGSGQDHG